MYSLPIVKSLGIATILFSIANPAHAIMARPDGGIGTGYFATLSDLSAQCPMSSPHLAMAQKWRRGMPCPIPKAIIQETDETPAYVPYAPQQADDTIITE